MTTSTVTLDTTLVPVEELAAAARSWRIRNLGKMKGLEED